MQNKPILESALKWATQAVKVSRLGINSCRAISLVTTHEFNEKF